MTTNTKTTNVSLRWGGFEFTWQSAKHFKQGWLWMRNIVLLAVMAVVAYLLWSAVSSQDVQTSSQLISVWSAIKPVILMVLKLL